MTAIPFPLLSAPGRHPQAAGGRLINVSLEQLSNTAGQKYAYWRAPGLRSWGTSTGANYRGSLLVGNLLYAVIDNSVFTFSSAGGAGTQLAGTVPGDVPVFMARNNKQPAPDIVIVAPGDGAFVVAGGVVSSYPDTDIAQPNSVLSHKSFFVFTYGDGKVQSSDANSTNINTAKAANAEDKPDGLLRAIPLGNGQLLLCGTSSMEVWGGANDTGFPWSYIATIPRGIVGPYAIAGQQDGFGKGLFLVGDDYAVHTLNGYQTVKISPDDLDRVIEAETNKAAITVSPFIAGGHSYVAVQAATWCWIYDVGLQEWTERQSYLQTYWRGLFPVSAFGGWYCGDRKSGNLLKIDNTAQDEVGDPLRMRIETGPVGAFPKVIRVNGIEIYLTKGVGNAEGNDPVQTKPDIEVSTSRDGGVTWSKPRALPLGEQALSAGRVRSAIWGQVDDVQGVRWRFDISSNVLVGLMGADMQVDVLR